jgi:hypothetical protein
VRLTQNRADPRAGGTANDRTFQSSAEQRAQNRAASCPNQRTLARSNPTLVPVSIMVVTSVIVPAATAVADSVVKIAPILRSGGKTDRQHERSDQHCNTRPQHNSSK